MRRRLALLALVLPLLAGCKTQLELDLAGWPGISQWVEDNVQVDRHVGPPMKGAWETTAIAWPGRIIVDDDCADGFCWRDHAPTPREVTAVHEAGHAIEIPWYFQPGVEPFTRGERWAQCVAAAVTGHVQAYFPEVAYWACPEAQIEEARVHLRWLGIVP